jgi:hypothetical protein
MTFGITNILRHYVLIMYIMVNKPWSSEWHLMPTIYE